MFVQKKADQAKFPAGNAPNSERKMFSLGSDIHKNSFSLSALVMKEEKHVFLHDLDIPKLFKSSTGKKLSLLILLNIIQIK